MEELKAIKKDIAETKAELEKAMALPEKDPNRINVILSLRAHLTELQKEKNMDSFLASAGDHCDRPSLYLHNFSICVFKLFLICYEFKCRN